MKKYSNVILTEEMKEHFIYCLQCNLDFQNEEEEKYQKKFNEGMAFLKEVVNNGNYPFHTIRETVEELDDLLCNLQALDCNRDSRGYKAYGDLVTYFKIGDDVSELINDEVAFYYAYQGFLENK